MRGKQAEQAGLADEGVLAEVLRRVGSPSWDRFSAQLARTGGCAQPVRLRGKVKRVDPTSGEVVGAFDSAGEPDGVLLKACWSRRATRCPACAATYKSDARQLVLAGLVGGKGVSAEVANWPLVFVTLTAPSFGPVHSVRPEGTACRSAAFCWPCGEAHACWEHHGPADPALGTPICPKSYDYTGVVIWNNRAGELWRRTMIAARRDLARCLGTSARAFERAYSLAYVKVVEYQRRGVVHVHALVRLGPVPGACDVEPSAMASALVGALSRAVATTTVPGPLPGRAPLRWGPQARVEQVPAEGRVKLAEYLAKYTTKSVDDAGALDHRLKRGELAVLAIDEHLRRLAKAAWDLGSDPGLARYRFREWAHTFGYRGHWLTKSPAWSTTFAALRRARYDYQARRAGEAADESLVVIGDWAYEGTGHRGEGDAWLAEAHRRARQLNRRTRWEES